MKRHHMPLSVKLASALIALGLDPESVDWHHEPSLALRPINPETGDTEPPQLDPRHIVPMSRPDHKVRTFGTSRPLSGDVSLAAKLKRVDRKQAEFRDRLLAKGTGAPALVPGKRKVKIQSRPFPKRGKIS